MRLFIAYSYILCSLITDYKSAISVNVIYDLLLWARIANPRYPDSPDSADLQSVTPIFRDTHFP